MKEFGILSSIDKTNIQLYIWDDVKEAKAVVQLSHGMAEHLRRYDDLAKFLNSNGYIVIGDDHRAHGKTSGNENLGIALSRDCFFDTVNDMKQISDFAISKYKLPLFILGHSYGSFLVQAYIQEASDKIKAAVIVGSAMQKGVDIIAANIISKIQKFFVGGKKPAKLLTKLGFASFDNPFKAENQKNAWLNRNKEKVIAYNSDAECGFDMSIDFYVSMTNAFKVMYKRDRLDSIRKDLPLMIISGAADPVGKQGRSTTKLKNLYDKYGLNVKQIKLYPEARHEILNEVNNDEVYNDVLNFLNSSL